MVPNEGCTTHWDEGGGGHLDYGVQLKYIFQFCIIFFETLFDFMSDAIRIFVLFTWRHDKKEH